jgi:hypothetical protein
MIYLIITTCLNPKAGINDAEHRERTYIDSISHTLKVLPDGIKPIIVENNGQRSTFLDDFGIDVLYTNNNQLTFPSKAGNELADIRAVIQRFGIRDEDMVIKITGRYKVMSPRFFKDVMDDREGHDAFIKFFNVCTKKHTPGTDCVLGLVAMTAKFYKMFEYKYPHNLSTESEFAAYVSSNCKYKEVHDLDLLCCFAGDHSILRV